MDVNLIDLNETLAYLAAGGGALVVTWIVSRFLEGRAFWAKLDSLTKRAASIVGAGLIGLAAWSVVTYVPAEFLAAIAPAYSAFMLSALTAAGGQLVHAAAKVLKARIS